MTKKRAILGGLGLLVLVALVLLFMPERIPVETAAVTRGPLQVLVDEEGETRVLDEYVVTAPVAAYIRRIQLEPGDPVEAGQVIVRLEPPRDQIPDPRARAELEARVETARAQLAEAEVTAATATAELERIERLVAAEAATPRALETATAEAARAMAALEAARAELEAAEAALQTAAGAPALPVADELRAPASGRVLVVHRRSEGQVTPGEPLLEVGDTERLEVASEVLSQDAVRIRPGARVVLDEWGGQRPLEGRVRQLDPRGFTRVSALGVEERRVRVLVDVVSPPAEYAGLGAGYQVLARFVVWEHPATLRAPTGAIFRRGDAWAAFVIEGGRARLRDVVIGEEAGLAVQVLSGLEEGDVVIVHPGNEVEHGVRVRPRE